MPNAKHKQDRPCDDFVNDVLLHQKALRQRALNLTKNFDAAEDLTQDTIVKALAASGSFEPGTNIKAWLFTIMRNHFLSGLRKKKEVELDPEWEKQIPDPADTFSLEEEDQIEYDFETALHAMASISEKYIDAVVLHDVADHAYSSIANEIGLAEGTVKSRIGRGRTKVAATLSSGSIPVYDIELWLTQKILSAHDKNTYLLAKAYELLLARYKVIRPRIDATQIPQESQKDVLADFEKIDPGIEDLFDDF
jgi:RNA polymerase sigma-70 factor, ECF subfamily